MAKTQSNSNDAAAPKQKARKEKTTKAETLLRLLRSKRGASVEQLRQAVGWQSHSIHGFLSGTVRKRMGLTLVSDRGNDGRLRYRVEPGTGANR